MYYFYILQSESTGRYYIGQTDNLDRRLSEHNDSRYTGSKTTKRFKGSWKLVYSEEYKARHEAMARERQIKGWKSRGAIERLIRE
jgi:putative endonuclease